MILALRTSEPTCRMVLMEKGRVIAQKQWLAERRLAKELLGQLETFLRENNIQFEDVTGLIIFRGPGSYTGLRIGASVMNTLAYALEIPIAGETGDDWLKKGHARLKNQGDDKIVIPEYGGLPNITTPKK